MSQHIAYLGPAGTHTEMACLEYNSKAVRLPRPSIIEAANAVSDGLAEECIVPIENSLQGSVTETLDLLIHKSSLMISNELVLPIEHCLLANKGAKLDDIKIIYSHPQALAQCRLYIAKYLPQSQEVASMSTSGAVEEMKKYGIQAAAIASSRASKLYDCQVLARSIADNPNNMTRFVILSKSDHPRTGNDKTSICFSFGQDKSGMLYSTLSEFSERNINLTKIESRPTRESLGQYIFLIDLEGHRQDQIVNQTLLNVKSKVSTFKVFGSYPRSYKI